MKRLEGLVGIWIKLQKELTAPGMFMRGYGRSESDYGRGMEDAEGDVEEAAVDT